MYTNAFCPITDVSVNERAARINALITLAITAGAIGLGQPHWLAFLAVDFYLRAFGFQHLSPLARCSNWLVVRFGLGTRRVNAGPKLFAARIGLIFSLLVVIFAFAGFHTLALSIAGILGFCALLEGFFGFCVACAIYPLVYRWVYSHK